MLQINQILFSISSGNNNLILSFTKPFSWGRTSMFGNYILYKNAKSRLIITLITMENNKTNFDIWYPKGDFYILVWKIDLGWSSDFITLVTDLI